MWAFDDFLVVDEPAKNDGPCLFTVLFSGEPRLLRLDPFVLATTLALFTTKDSDPIPFWSTMYSRSDGECDIVECFVGEEEKAGGVFENAVTDWFNWLL